METTKEEIAYWMPLFKAIWVFLKKRKVGLIVIAAMCLITFHFLPQQEGYYLYEVRNKFENTCKMVLLILLESVLVLVFIVTFIKSVPTIKEFFARLLAMGYVAIILCCWAMLLSDVAATVALALNRNVSKGYVTVQASVFEQYSSHNDSTDIPLTFIDPKTKEFYSVTVGVTKSQYVLLDRGDIVNLHFNKGLFGIPCNPVFGGVVKKFVVKN